MNTELNNKLDIDVIYFELNNWFSGRDYPNSEPFISWCGEDSHLQFDDEKWVKLNKLCVRRSLVDMSANWCITATKSWVEQNCPDLLSNKTYSYINTIIYPSNQKKSIGYYKDFLRYPDDDGEVFGRFGCPFLVYSEENFGISIWDEYE